MRVLITCHIRHATGEVRAVRELAEGLRRRGHEVWVAAPATGVLARRLSDGPVRVLDLAFPSGGVLRAARALAALARELRADVVDAHGGRDRKAAVAARLLYGMRARLVITRRAPGSSFPLQNLLYAAAADRVVAISDALAARLARRGGWRRRIAVVRPGLDPARLANDVTPDEVAALRHELALDAARPTVAMVARRKDQETLLRAVACLGRPVNVLFVGIERDERLAALERALPATARVAYAGFRERVEPFLALADVAVLASRGEGLSQAALEALAAGLPIAAAAVGGVPEVVKDGETGLLFGAGDAAALAAALSRLLDDAALRARLAAAGREHVRRNFDMERMLRETENVYAAVLAETARPAARVLPAGQAAL